MRWSAIGAAIAVTLGAGGLGIAQAAVSSGDRPVTVTIAAERILDTRVDLGLAGKFTDSSPRDLQVTGPVEVASGGQQTVVPADAVAVIVNVTVIRPNRPGFLSLRPGGAVGSPTTSTVNFLADSIEPNSATVDLNDGKIQIWLAPIADAGTADVAIDVVGYTIDHDHDDRYYTQAEVDERSTPMFATIVSNGGVYQGRSSGLVSSERFSTGDYVLTFNRNLDGCTVVSSDVIQTITRDVSSDVSGGAADQVNVRVTDAAGVLVDTVFSVIVQCLPD